jgi:hypothetical protein
MKEKITLISAAILLTLCIICQYVFYFFYDPYPIINDLPFWFVIPRIIFLIPAWIILNYIFRKKKFIFKQVVLLLIAILALLFVLIVPGKYIYIAGMEFRIKNFVENNKKTLEKLINSDQETDREIKLNWVAIAPDDKLYRVYKKDKELTIILYRTKMKRVCIVYSEKEIKSRPEYIIFVSPCPRWTFIVSGFGINAVKGL